MKSHIKGDKAHRGKRNPHILTEMQTSPHEKSREENLQIKNAVQLDFEQRKLRKNKSLKQKVSDLVSAFN